MPGPLSKFTATMIPEGFEIAFRFLRDFKRLPKHPRNSYIDYLYHVMRRRVRRDYFKLCDKAEAKQYVAEKFGEKYLVPTLTVADSSEEINWSSLPESFIMKATHASALNRIVKKKSNEDLQHLCSLVDWWLSQDYYYKYREWIYKGVRGRVLIENFIDTGEDILNDYKYHCFDGKIALIEVIVNDRDTEDEAYVVLYDTSWNKHNVKWGEPNELDVPKPDNLDEMNSFAETASEGMDYVRVDMYSHENKVYFGEFTFMPGANRADFDPIEFNENLKPFLEKVNLDKHASHEYQIN